MRLPSSCRALQSLGTHPRLSAVKRTLAGSIPLTARFIAVLASKRKTIRAVVETTASAKRTMSQTTKQPASTHPHPPYYYTALVTGANRGLGLEFVRQLAQRHDPQKSKIYAACRTPDEATDLKLLVEQHSNIRILPPLDVTDAQQIRHAVNAIQQSSHPYLCLLVNNSGVQSNNHPHDPVLECPQDDFMRVFNVNVGGTLQMFQHTYPLLTAAKKQMQSDKNASDAPAIHATPTVINITSNLASIADNQMGGNTAYRASKTALNMLTKTCAVDHRDMLFLNQSPGWADTLMGSAGGRKPPLKASASVQSMIALWERLSMDDSGKFLDYDGKVVPW